MKPILLINFKTYKSGTGESALKLAKICNDISRKKNVRIMIAVQTADIFAIARKVNIPVLAQHVDYFEQDRHTGAIIPEDVKEEGAFGTLINHSEHRLRFNILKRTVVRCKEVDLKTIVCAASISEVKKIVKLKPYMIMFEDPKLVSTGKSITKIEPKSVKEFVNIVNKTKSGAIPLCGAGISTKEDVKLALELGCKGVGVASAILKSRNHYRKILELIE